MPEWLDLVMWTRALDPWRSELLLAAMLANLVAAVLVTRQLREDGPQMFGDDPPWIIERFGVAGLWGVLALYWLLSWWLATGPIFALFLLGGSIYVAVQYLRALGGREADP